MKLPTPIQAARPLTEIEKLRFSFNPNHIQSGSANQTVSLIQLATLIRKPEDLLQKKIFQIRMQTKNLLDGFLTESDKRKLQANIDSNKKNVGYYLNGVKKSGHGADGLAFASCIFFDLDLRFRGGDIAAQAIKEFLSQFEFVCLCHISLGGYGVKGIFYTDIKECSSDLYTYAEKQIFTFLKEKGFRERYDRHALGKTCYLSHDEDVYLNINAKPFHIDLEGYETHKKTQITLYGHTETHYSADELGKAAQYLIENQIDIGAVCYDDYRDFCFSCIDAFDTEGGSIALQILENSPIFLESSFYKKFDKAYDSLLKAHTKRNEDKITATYFLRIAKENGFRFDQKTQSVKIENYTPQHLDLLIINRKNALNLIKKDPQHKIIICEKSYIPTVQKEMTGQQFSIYTYQDVSKIPYDEAANVYVFGSHNFIRRNYVDSVNEIEQTTKTAKTIFFSETYTRLPIAKQTYVIDTVSLNAKVIISESPKSTFVELCKNDKNSYFLDTSESIKKQFKEPQMVKRSELYQADKAKRLYVLFDANCGMMPEHFAGFSEVVFIVHSEKKKYSSMKAFCNANEKMIYDFLQMTDNEIHKAYIEKMFVEVVRDKKIAIKKVDDTWVRCNNIACMLEYEHESKLLAADSNELLKYLERFKDTTIDIDTAIITEDTEQITHNIKQSQKDLTAEKKAEFFQFLDTIENMGISNMSELYNFVNQIGRDMKRGEKIALNRIKTLLKLNNSFSMCFEAVKESYNQWTRTKGRFLAAKVAKGKSIIADAINTLRDTTEGQLLGKHELLDLASSLKLIIGDANTKWKQLKRICHIRSVRKRIQGNRVKLYELVFL